MEHLIWPLINIEPFGADDVTSLWIPDTQSNTWQWEESVSTSYIGLSQPVPFEDSAINSPDSFQSSESFLGSSYADSSFDASPHEPLLDFGILSEVKVAGRPRAPVTNGRDPNENRIQRRRTQNRNSQRIYRQRRIEERNVFEARATAAEDSSAKLRLELKELNSEVARLGERVKDLELENAKLRTCSISTGDDTET